MPHTKQQEEKVEVETEIVIKQEGGNTNFKIPNKYVFYTSMALLFGVNPVLTVVSMFTHADEHKETTKQSTHSNIDNAAIIAKLDSMNNTFTNKLNSLSEKIEQNRQHCENGINELSKGQQSLSERIDNVIFRIK